MLPEDHYPPILDFNGTSIVPGAYIAGPRYLDGVNTKGVVLGINEDGTVRIKGEHGQEEVIRGSLYCAISDECLLTQTPYRLLQVTRRDLGME